MEEQYGSVVHGQAQSQMVTPEEASVCKDMSGLCLMSLGSEPFNKSGAWPMLVPSARCRIPGGRQLFSNTRAVFYSSVQC